MSIERLTSADIAPYALQADLPFAISLANQINPSEWDPDHSPLHEQVANS